jgi:hypothetical protein
MKYRRLDSQHDMTFGRGKNDYLVDITGNPVAVAQAIKTRLLLFLGEWWEDLDDGLPLWQQILGSRLRNKAVVDQILVKRIKETRLPDGEYPVLDVLNVESTYDGDTREYSFECEVDTIYGQLTVTNSGMEVS